MGELFRFRYCNDLRNGKMNPDHVYEYFGQFNGISAKAVRKNLLEFISGNMKFVEDCSSVFLPMKEISLETWIDCINDGCNCDELALLVLSAMYKRHSIVVTKVKSWCTIELSTPLTLLKAMSECTV